MGWMHRWGITPKLMSMVFLPLIAIMLFSVNAVQSMKAMSSSLLASVYDEAYAGTSMLLRADQTSVHHASAQTSEVFENCAQVRQLMDRMVTSLLKVAALSEQYTGNTRTVAAAAKEQQATMTQISSASHKLARMAEQLLSFAAKFKL